MRLNVNRTTGSLKAANVRLIHAELSGNPEPQRPPPTPHKLTPSQKAEKRRRKLACRLARIERRRQRQRLGIKIAPPVSKKRGKRYRQPKPPQLKTIGLRSWYELKMPKWRSLQDKKERVASRIEQTAARLRENPPPSEKLMLAAFQEKAAHHHLFRFSHNRTLGPYIPDFYFPAAKLIVECDGSQHGDPDSVEHDRRRDLYFEQLGIKTMRFTNTETALNRPAVLKRIIRMVETRSELFLGSVVPRVCKSPAREGAMTNVQAVEVTATYDKSGDSASA